MYNGRTDNGTELRLHVQCKTSTGQIVEPDVSPTIDIWFEGARVLTGLQMFPEERLIVTGFFVYPLYVQNLSVGTYTCVLRWTHQGYNGVELAYFEVIPGGDNRGSVVAMFYFDTPQGRFLVQQTDAGQILMGKNPQ